jgi:putative oxidoreductase
MSSPNATVVIIARILLAAMFVASGLSKFGNLSGTANYIASGGLPMASLLAPAVAALELFGGLALIVGFQTRWVALALALFTLAASVLFHAFWAVPAEQAFVQQLMFMKNLGVAGGMLMLFSFGAGPGSLDARRAKA